MVLIGPVSRHEMWLSVTMIGISFGTPFSRSASRTCFIICGSRYSDFHVMLHGSKG